MNRNQKRELVYQERRYQRAKKYAKKHLRAAEKHGNIGKAWIRIMEDSVAEQKRIMEGEANENRVSQAG